MKLQLTPHWRLIFKQWSFWIGTAGTALTSALLAFPGLALDMWQLMPDDLKHTIPERYTPFIGVGVFALGLASKFIRQTKLEAQRSQTNGT